VCHILLTCMVDYQTAGWIAASSHRLTVAEYLIDNGPAIPTTIEEDTGLACSHISRALGDMRERNLVELLVADDVKKGRVYGAKDELSDIVDTAVGL